MAYRQISDNEYRDWAGPDPDAGKPSDCERFGHDYSRSKTVKVDAFGTKTRRVYYCSFCGEERPTRNKKS